MNSAQDLSGKIRRGFFFSLLNNITLRLGTLATGIVLARILAPEDFGVYAVALTVQSILVNLSELGLAADLVRHGDIGKRGPTIATLSIIASSSLTAIMWLTAVPVANVMGAPEAAPVIKLMSFTLLLAGIGVVPYASLQRDFKQGRLFAIDGVNFVLTTGLTVVLAIFGFGPMSLAISRLVSQIVATSLQFVLSGSRFRVGWDRTVALSGLRFGVPLSLAGLLAWVLLNVDNMLVGHLGGPVLLGMYVLAFNVSSWPTSVVGSAIRAVAMPAFSQSSVHAGTEGRNAALVRATALTWAAAAPIAAGLILMAQPIVAILYGQQWMPAAAALLGLGLFGGLRVVFDLWVAFLTASGAAGSLLWTQGAWILALVPTMFVGIKSHGLAGAGWAHSLVAIFIMLPLYLLAVARTGGRVRPILVVLAIPTAALIPAVVVASFLMRRAGNAWITFILAGTSLIVIYGALMAPWLLRRVRPGREPETTMVDNVQKIPATTGDQQ